MNFDISGYLGERRSQSQEWIKVTRKATRTISEETWNHEFCAIADRVDSAVFDDNSLVSNKQALQGSDHSAKIGLYDTTDR